jgi:hypothetical protein
MPEHLVEPRLDPRRDGALQPHGLLVRLGPAKADDAGQEPFEQGMPAEDGIGRRPAGTRQAQIPTVRVIDEAVGGEPAEHLRGRLGRHAEVPRHARGRHLRPIGRTGGDP